MNFISQRLHNLAHNQKLPHGMLFVGLAETEKQRAAFELSQFLFCTSPNKEKSCGACPACKKAQNQHHPDLYTLQNGQKEILIGDIRSFQKWLSIRPHEAKYKVGLLYNAERLNLSSANSLLKTLEEPPPHGIIILLVRTAAGVLKTIQSRLMQVTFSFTSSDDSPLGNQPPDWLDELHHLLNQNTSISPNQIFHLTEVLAKDRENLNWFFHSVEKKLKGDLFKAHREALPIKEIRKMESLFDLALRAERATFRRYGNIGLWLDHFLLTWLSPQSQV